MQTVQHILRLLSDEIDKIYYSYSKGHKAFYAVYQHWIGAEQIELSK
jgi:hypothetical protein